MSNIPGFQAHMTQLFIHFLSILPLFISVYLKVKQFELFSYRGQEGFNSSTSTQLNSTPSFFLISVCVSLQRVTQHPSSNSVMSRKSFPTINLKTLSKVCKSRNSLDYILKNPSTAAERSYFKNPNGFDGEICVEYHQQEPNWCYNPVNNNDNVEFKHNSRGNLGEIYKIQMVILEEIYGDIAEWVSKGKHWRVYA